MIHPLQITFRNIDHTDEADKLVREEAQKLDKYYPRIMSCRVLIETPHRHRGWGNPYRLRIDLGVPGKEIVVKHEPSLHGSGQRLAEAPKAKRLEVEAPYKDLPHAIREAFKAAKRQLQEYARERRRNLKTHVPSPRATVFRLLPEKECGFLVTSDEREIYFHKKSVLNDAYDRLEVGTEVIFAEEQGENGPQASTVKLTRRHLTPYTGRKSLLPVRALP